MALTLFYLINSFTANLPWSECRDEWITETSNFLCAPSKDVNKSALTENTISSSELYFT